MVSHSTACIHAVVVTQPRVQGLFFIVPSFIYSSVQFI